MGIYTSLQSSYQAQGPFRSGLPYDPKGEKNFFRQHNMKMPQEGLLHSMKRGIKDYVGIDNTGAGRLMDGAKGFGKTYGGGIFSSGGWREITHKAEQIGKTGFYKTGARRSAGAMLGHGLMKGLGPAMFIHTAMTEGIGTATQEAVVGGAIWGAARWSLGKIGLGLTSPFAMGAAVLAGGVIGGRAALIAGRQYNKDIRKANFGNAAPDSYGTIGTMRQASVHAIQSSKINGRSALGSEANLMHL